VEAVEVCFAAAFFFGPFVDAVVIIRHYCILHNIFTLIRVLVPTAINTDVERR